ncbi:hypothetical protein ACFYO1_12480 [Nocardia sp. NPDC006044]|uniref:hypothetical protein n=1 Tax=Nocardia sp. NPDC006044 TaxID=3364306 RepID=UPI0036C2CC90
MSGGFYNHYDDPDEYWDEEPLRSAPKAPPVASAPSAPTPSFSRPAPTARDLAGASSSTALMASLGLTPPPKSSLVSVTVGPDRLPVDIKLGRNWKAAFDPSQYGKSIVDAYRYGMYEWAARTVESGALPPSTVPSLRNATPLLLRTRTIEDYRGLYDQLFLETPLEVHGPGRDAFGRPALTVIATWSKLISISLDPGWVEGIEVDFVAQDILECCAQIRARKPRPVHDIYLDQETDSELAARVLAHERYLMEYS